MIDADLEALVLLVEEKIGWLNSVENLEGLEWDAYLVNVSDEELVIRKNEVCKEVRGYQLLLEKLKYERVEAQKKYKVFES